MAWDLPERVKRLSLPSYRYTELDFDHLEMMVAKEERRNIIGVAAWEQADARDAPAEYSVLLLHGLYIDPGYRHQGIGRQLFQTAEEFARERRYDGLLVKAQEDAIGFFVSQGMTRLEAEDPSRQYANRCWKGLHSR